MHQVHCNRVFLLRQPFLIIQENVHFLTPYIAAASSGLIPKEGVGLGVNLNLA